MSKIEDFLRAAKDYYAAKDSLSKSFAEAKDEIVYRNLSDDEKSLLYKMLKEQAFELKVFDFFLKKAPHIALEYLNDYYLKGEPIEDKSRYQTNLDIMLDDVRELLGEDKIAEIIQDIPKSTRQFFPIKRAVKFLYDANSDQELPAWY